MKLKQFLEDRTLTQEEFINLCKEKTGHTFTQGCISKWILEKRRPRADECNLLFISTDGHVTPNDFYLDDKISNFPWIRMDEIRKVNPYEGTVKLLEFYLSQTKKEISKLDAKIFKIQNDIDTQSDVQHIKIGG